MISATQKLDRQDALVTRVFGALRASVLNYVCRRISGGGYGNVEDAEDICQDVFLEILNYKVFLDERTIGSLVFKIASNKVIDYLRRHARRQEAQEYFFVHGHRSACVVENEIHYNDCRRMMAGCLKVMSPCKAQIFIRYIYGGECAVEIAGKLNLSVRTVENQLYRARKEIKGLLSDVS